MSWKNGKIKNKKDPRVSRSHSGRGIHGFCIKYSLTVGEMDGRSLESFEVAAS